jgi:hypothetical protein
MFQGKLITIFNAYNYFGKWKNKSEISSIDNDIKSIISEQLNYFIQRKKNMKKRQSVWNLESLSVEIDSILKLRLSCSIF